MTNYQTIPIELSEIEFDLYVKPYLPKQISGPPPKVPLYKIYGYILHVLYTGCQWKSLSKVIEKNSNGSSQIHYTNVFRRFRLWSSSGVFTKHFEHVLRVLSQRGHLDLTQLNGDGTNVVAKKGGQKWAIVGINTKKVAKI